VTDADAATGHVIPQQTLERMIRFRPAFDRRSEEPGKNFGIHGVEMRASVVGPWGAVSLTVFTGWMLPHLRNEGHRPMAADLSYHSATECADSARQPCNFMPQGFCWLGGPGFDAADAVFEELLTRGDAGMWDALERHYRSRFEAG
jgi:hypothetical protein